MFELRLCLVDLGDGSLRHGSSSQARYWKPVFWTGEQSIETAGEQLLTTEGPDNLVS